MNAVTVIEAEGVQKLRAPFPANQISKLPKPTKAQTEAVKTDYKNGIRCKECGSWHHPEVVHLDYVGHAALTDRLLDTDPMWSWEPLALRDGLPAFDASGGLWIKLTVCGVSRLGYGHAAAKPGIDPGAREKEVIGDALRNAAMRFGAALDLWHKGDLHAEDAGAEPPKPNGAGDDTAISDRQRQEIMALAVAKGINAKTICEVGGYNSIKEMPALAFERCKAWIAKQPGKATNPNPQSSDVLEDEIPY